MATQHTKRTCSGCEKSRLGLFLQGGACSLNESVNTGPSKACAPRTLSRPYSKHLFPLPSLHLGQQSSSTAVSAYDTGTIDHKSAKDDVHTVLNGLRINSYNRLDHVVRHLALVLRLEGNFSEPSTLPENPVYHHSPEQLLFAIEYTRDSLTAGLWREQCGVMKMTSRLNSAQFGHDAMQACRDADESRWTCDEDLKAALHSVSADSSRGERGELGVLLLFGESALNEATLVALRQVLEEQFSNGDSVEWSRVQEYSRDLACAGSRAMARTDWTARGSEREDGYKRELQSKSRLVFAFIVSTCFVCPQVAMQIKYSLKNAELHIFMPRIQGTLSPLSSRCLYHFLHHS